MPRQDHGNIKIRIATHRVTGSFLARTHPVARRPQIPAHVRLGLRLLPRRGAGHGLRSLTLPNTGITAQLCGDAHVRNFGAFASPDGRLVFDINDFDETIPGPFEWDVKRLATSLVLAEIEIGSKASQREPAILAAADTIAR